MKAVTRELGRTTVGRALLVCWGALPVLALVGGALAVAVGAGVLVGLASPVLGCLLGSVLTGALAPLAYRAGYRQSAATGVADIAPVPGRRVALGASAAGALLALPVGVVLAVAALPAAAAVPVLLAGVSWTSAACVVVLAVLVAPFVLRRVALLGWAGLRGVPNGILEAAAAPGLTLRLSAATAAAIAAALLIGPAVLMIVTGVLAALHVVLLDEQPETVPQPVQET